MPSTPEHILWAIERACPHRHAKDWADPEQTERELRPLRAYADATFDGRVFDGICVEQSNADLGESGDALGFPVAEIFDAFGESDFLETTCGRCLANLPQGDGCSLAGCYGWFDARDIKPRVDRMIADLISDGRGDLLSRFDLHRFQHGFYSLWTQSVWRSETLSQATEFFSCFADDRAGHAPGDDLPTSCGGPALGGGLPTAPPQPSQADDHPCVDIAVVRFSVGLRVADEHGCAMRVKLVPRGELAGNWWTVTRHCPNCRAEWPEHGRRCMECAYQGGAVPARKRHARGKRPFVPLSRVIGKHNVGDFLRRYAQRELEETEPRG